MAEIDVSSILQNAPQFKSVSVDKDDDLKYDLGRLCAYDYHPVSSQEIKNDANALKELSRDNVQLLFTKIFQLPSQVVEDGVLAELPKPFTVLPRAKPLPEAKPPTRWEQFAKIKGIPKKSRKPQLIWDEEHQEYRRRYGHMRANNQADAWVLPADESNPYGKDPFAQQKDDKKARLEKQEKQEKRNKKDAQLQKARVQSASGAKAKDDISRTFALVSRSTASLGRFDRRLPGETEAPKMKGTRKNAGLGSATGPDLKAEKSANLNLIDKMINKEEKLNKNKAASQFIAKEMQERRKRNNEELISGKAFKKPKK